MTFRVNFARIIFAVGAFVGLLLIFLAVWGDYEADSYGFQRRANAPLRGLSCPILMTGGTDVIGLKLSNSTDKTLRPSVRMEISKPFTPDVFVESIELAPGESENLKWSIGPGNIDLGYFIFANVQVYATYPIPNRESTCGILVLNLPVNGRWLTAIALILSLLGMGFGLVLISRQYRSGQTLQGNPQGLRLRLFLALVLTAGIYFGWMGLWLPGTVALVVSLLTILINFTTSSSVNVG